MNILVVILIGAVAVYVLPRIGAADAPAPRETLRFSMWYVIIALVLGVVFWPAIGPVFGYFMDVLIGGVR